MHHTMEAFVDFYQHILMFHTYIVIKFCTYNPTSNFTEWSFTTIMQGCHNPNSSHKIPQPCDNLVGMP